MAYKIEYSRDAASQVGALSGRQRATILDGVEKHLCHQPQVETRNRKQMRPNKIAPWELRLGDLRVYYDVSEANSKVVVHAIGIKERNVVRIAGEVIDL